MGFRRAALAAGAVQYGAFEARDGFGRGMVEATPGCVVERLAFRGCTAEQRLPRDGVGPTAA